MVVFSKLCAGLSAFAVSSSALHIAPGTSSKQTSVQKSTSQNTVNLAVQKAYAAAQKKSDAAEASTAKKSKESKRVHRRRHGSKKGDEGGAGDGEAWSGEDYIADSEEDFPAEADVPGEEKVLPPLTKPSAVTEHWDVEDLSCAYGVFTPACPSTHFCYRNFAAAEAEPAQCTEKRVPNSACGVFDEKFWGVVCASGAKADGSEQRFSCQAVKPEGAAEPEEPEEEAIAEETDIFMGSKEGMCKPCCDMEAEPECKDFPECPYNYEDSGVEMKIVEDTTDFCIKGEAGEEVKGCPSGPVKLEEAVDMCVTIEDFAAETDIKKFKKVLEEPIPASAEGELHEAMKKMALKKADVCKPPPPPPEPKPEKADGGSGKDGSGKDGSGKDGSGKDGSGKDGGDKGGGDKPKPDGKAGAKGKAKAKAKAGAKASPAGGDAGAAADAAAEAASEDMDRAAPEGEAVPDTTAPTDADAQAQASEDLAMELHLKGKKTQAVASAKTANAVQRAYAAAQKKSDEAEAGKKMPSSEQVVQEQLKKRGISTDKKIVPRTAEDIKRGWASKAAKTINTDKLVVKRDEVKAKMAEESVKKVAQLLKTKKPAAATVAAAKPTAAKPVEAKK